MQNETNGPHTPPRQPRKNYNKRMSDVMCAINDLRSTEARNQAAGGYICTYPPSYISISIIHRSYRKLHRTLHTAHRKYAFAACMKDASVACSTLHIRRRLKVRRYRGAVAVAYHGALCKSMDTRKLLSFCHLWLGHTSIT